MTSENLKEQAPQEDTEIMSDEAPKKKNTYSDAFKKEVAEAAQLPGATLASVGEQFGVSPTLVRNWKIKFLEQTETPIQPEEKQPTIECKSIQSWLQKSLVEGTIDSDGDLYVSLETSSEETTQEPTKLFITGTQKLASGSKNETSEISDQITTNETNWLRSDFLKGVGKENAQFSYNLSCDVYGCAERVVIPLKLKKGKVSECPISAGQIGISELNFVFEDGDFRAEGTITGPNGFIYAAEILTEEPQEGHVPAVNKTADDESTTEMYEFLWDVKKGDTVFVVLCAFEKLEGKLNCGFTGEAKVEEPISYDDGDDTNSFDEDKNSDYAEVVIDDEDNEQYYYWVLTEDEDEAVEAALKKHEEMGRPNAVNDEDAGVFPMAYQPVTEFGSESAIKIHVDGTDVLDESGSDDIGLFEFQIKRGYVDEDSIEDDELKELVTKLKALCAEEDFESASKLLMTSLSFEFGPDELDDDPEKYFSDLDYIEFECTDENTAIKVGIDDEGALLVTITVKFEIALEAGISISELEDYLSESGAWAAASASPGWGYFESDGENVRFLGLKGDGGSGKYSFSNQSEKASDDFEGAVYAITVQRSESVIDFENLSANNGSMKGPLLTFFVAYDAEQEGFHIVLEGEKYFYASSDEYDWEAPKYALENIKHKLMVDLSISESQVDKLIYYLTANITDEAEDIDDSSFKHIVTEVGEINGEDHFEGDTEALNRIWVSTSQNLAYINISLNLETNTLDFDEDALSEKEVVSWSDFIVGVDEDIFPFENFKTPTAIKFVKFINSLPDDTFSAVAKYATDGLDLIENNGDLSEAKDDAKLISIANEDDEPFENADAYLECLIQNITDEIEMNGLEQPSAIIASQRKNISDLTSQQIGSMEFKIEVASACAESGMNYKDFAKMYNLNADELNAWAVEFLGKGFE